ncbi:unnamed protein product, partial [Rotaria sp. Silwood2]
TSIGSSTKLENIFKKIESLNKLITFTLFDPYLNLNEKDKCNLTRMMLIHKSSSLRSMVLKHSYDYADISNYTSISSNLTSLHLRIHGTRSTVSIHSVLIIFRLCHGIRHLGLTLEKKFIVKNNDINVPNSTLSLNDTDYPILPKLVSFNLSVFLIYDNYAIAYMLRCMPNLNRFNFFLVAPMKTSPYYRRLFNGYLWEDLLKRYAPCLSIFEFHISVQKNLSNLQLDYIVNSFQYFVRKYPNWNMAIGRWILASETSGKQY